MARSTRSSNPKSLCISIGFNREVEQTTKLDAANWIEQIELPSHLPLLHLRCSQPPFPSLPRWAFIQEIFILGHQARPSHCFPLSIRFGVLQNSSLGLVWIFHIFVLLIGFVSCLEACGSTFDKGGDRESNLDTSPHYCSSGVWWIVSVECFLCFWYQVLFVHVVINVVYFFLMFWF